MASPILQKLSPKSPLTFTQTLTKSLSVGFASQTSKKKSPQNFYLNPNHAQKARKPSPAENYLSPRLSNTVFVAGRRSDDGTTPNPSIAIKPSPDTPILMSGFSTTTACNALVQSPCRLENYKRQRRRLYHQDSVEEYGSISSAPGSANSFQSTPKIGKGGFGSVFVGKYDGKIVAIKQLHSTQNNRVNGESLCAELNAFKLNHPNIVKILTFTCSGSVIQIVSEYVGRKNLQKVLNDFDEKFDFVRRRRFCMEVAEALRFCHSNRVLHLDVKPANILITDNNDTCKLADFGCSRWLPLDSDALPLTPCVSSTAGTLIYKSPELLRGLPASTKSDVYSYGYVVWQIVTRQEPFENLNAHTVVFCVVAKNLRPKHKVSAESCEGDNVLLQLAEVCWHHDADKRPSFEMICTQLKNLKAI